MTSPRLGAPIVLLGAIAGAIAEIGCGGTAAKVLERIDGATPPGSNLRMDVFLIRSVSTCVIGNPCSLRDPSQCFFLGDASGARVSFAPDNMLDFVPPQDPRIGGATQSACFRLGMDDAEAASAAVLTQSLRTRVFQLTSGDVDLDVRLHDVATLDAGFKRYYTGLFLQPSAVATVALANINRETDFVYAITGFKDPDTGLSPKMDFCVGTNWLDVGVVGASAYTWLATSNACAQQATLFSSWMIQFFFGLRDIDGLPNLYAGGYPACGNGDPDPTRWFPSPDDCTTDPDAPGCGRASCPDRDAFNIHVLEKHWPRGRAFNGNYCDDGRVDHDETTIDRGGVCDLIAR